MSTRSSPDVAVPALDVGPKKHPSPAPHMSTSARTSVLRAMQSTTLYPIELDDDEKIWRDRYHFFREHKLELRPRYHPEWVPSWVGTDLMPTYCEDAIKQILPMVLDAKDGDGVVVCLKLTDRTPQEAEIAAFLSSLEDTRNHTIPILRYFQDKYSPDITFLVMPVVRPFDDPEFWAVGEVVDFATQMLEGLAFMHSHLVAHGDLTGVNIMMDGAPLYPQGWHFVANHYSPDGLNHLTPLARIDHPVRYFIVDYGLSVRLRPGEPYLITGKGGRDGDAPEVWGREPYDPFKLDVFTTGNVFLKDLHKKYLGLSFLVPLISSMMVSDPQQRPSAPVALDQWYKIKSQLDVAMARWRLKKPQESIGEWVVLDTVAAARQSIHSLKHLFDDRPRTWANP